MGKRSALGVILCAAAIVYAVSSLDFPHGPPCVANSCCSRALAFQECPVPVLGEKGVNRTAQPRSTASGGVEGKGLGEDTGLVTGTGWFGNDWSQCISRGGSTNCAKCNNGNSPGGLPCSTVTNPACTSNSGTGNMWTQYNCAANCPDSDILKTKRFFFVQGGVGKGVCRGLAADSVTKVGAMYLSDTMGSLSGQKNIVTQALVGFLEEARNVGYVILKRLVTHEHSGTEYGDTFKVGYCIRCIDSQFNNLFPNWDFEVTQTHKENFINNCLPLATNSDGTIKSNYECTSTQLEKVDAYIAGA